MKNKANHIMLKSSSQGEKKRKRQFSTKMTSKRTIAGLNI
jgi:hypothetical protein